MRKNTEKDAPDWMALFIEFDRKNPNIYTLFKDLTLDRIERGFTVYGARMVYGHIRWDFDEPVKNTKSTHMPYDDYKDPIRLNDSHSCFYARMFMHEEPQHEGFYRRRKTFIYEVEFQAWLDKNFVDAED